MRATYTVHIPKFVLFGMLTVVAGFMGWIVHDYIETTDLRPTSASSRSSEARSSPDAGQSAPVIRLQINEAGKARELADASDPNGSAVRPGSAECAAVASAPMSADAREIPVGRQGTGGVIVAHDGSIVLAGDGGRLKANTGDVSQGGVLGIDADRSTLTSGTSKAPDARSPEWTSAGRDAIPQDIAAAGYELSPGDSSAGRGETQLSSRALHHGTRGTAIAGFEDHSLNVTGKDNIVTYDDSNVFINRDGKINANTGDTDSSGLNVVDVKRSNVQSGDHIEDGEEDENGEEENGENGEEEASVAGETSTPASGSTPSAANNGNGAGSAGDSGGTATVADEGDASATGDDALAIGGDGYDDLAVDVAGKRNVATYDDSNVVQGGKGGANTQVGDSDTSGAVIMEATDSTIESGNST